MTKCVGRAARLWLAVPTVVCALGSSLLFGCGGGREHASPYAAAVFDDPPIYCYRTIGDVDCYKEPLPGAEQRLVNYYGPPPGDYEWPEPPPAPRLDAPPPGRPVPSSEVAPVLVPGPTPDSQPTLLYRPNPSSAASAPGAEKAMTTPGAEKAVTTPGAEKAVTTPGAEKAVTTPGAQGAGTAVSTAARAIAPPLPRPAPTAPPPAPLVIEVEGR